MLQAGVAVTRRILAEICAFYLTNRGAAVPVSSISVVAGLIPPSHPVPTDLGADIVYSVQGKTIIATRAVYRVTDQVTGEALHNRGAVCIAGQRGCVPVGKVVAGCTGSVVSTVQAVLDALVAVTGRVLAEVRAFYLTNRGASVPVKHISVVAGLVACNNAIPADLGAGIVRTVERKAVVAARAVDGVVRQVTGKALNDRGAVGLADEGS